MEREVIEKYQIAGLDERERGFSRLSEMERLDNAYHAVLRYETTLVRTDGCETPEHALDQLIRRLRERGYTQLKSRLNFRGDRYLGSQEPWIEYPDPDGPSEPPIRSIAEQPARRTGWIGKALRLLGGS
jgi:hypothetical protein